MFWSDSYNDRIYRAWLNGTGATILINTGLSNTGRAITRAKCNI